MDAVPDTSNFFIPTPPPEQVQRMEQERALSEAQMTLLRELVADLTEYEAWAKSIDGLSVESQVSIESQLMFKKSVAEWSQKIRSKYESRLRSVTEVQDGLGQ